jgi:hypothetical protein
MQNANKIRNRDLFLEILRNPKENLQAATCMALSGACALGVFLLNFIR